MVLIRLPYDKNSRYVFMEQVAGRLTRAGYVTVVQDVRGKYRSEGDPLGPVTEARDGYDTIDWIASQSWCDGAVGMFGDSYYGFTQWAAVSSGHPALRAIVPRVTTADLSIFLAGGNGEVRDVDWLTGASYMLQCWTGRYVNERMPDWKQPSLLAAFEKEFAELGERSHWFDLSLPHAGAGAGVPGWAPVHQAADPDAARGRLVRQRRRSRTCATTCGLPRCLTGDRCSTSGPTRSTTRTTTCRRCRSLRRPTTTATPRRSSACWTCTSTRPSSSSTSSSRVATRRPCRRCAGTWGTSATGPRPPGRRRRARARSLFLTAAGLGESPPTGSEEVGWTYDPADLVESALENSFAALFEYPDERATGERDDVLTFDGTPAVAPLDLAGPVDLWVRVSSSAPTTDVFAKLLDVDPDGSARMIVRGQAVLARPDADRLVRIEMGHTGYRAPARAPAAAAPHQQRLPGVRAEPRHRREPVARR